MSAGLRQLRRRGLALAALLGLSPAGVCWASVERFALIVGHNRGDADEPPLLYAEEDATRLHAVLADLGGFRPENMALLRGGDAAAVRRALIALNERVRAASSDRDREVLLFVYYSGHADAEALHLGGSALDLGELEQLVRGSAAAIRLMVLDACRSGALTRVKGGQPAPAFPIQLEERLGGEGVVFLSSTAVDEDAQESDALKGSFFSHFLISGLHGAADEDADGQVTLEEVYGFAYEQTLRATARTLAGVQHPTFDYQMRGQGGLVLTRPGHETGARVRFVAPANQGFLLFAEDAEGPVVLELRPRPGARTASLRPGRYFVTRRAEDHLLEGSFRARAGEVVYADRLQLERIDYARLVRKGGAELSMVHGPQAGFAVRTALPRESGLCAGAFAGYSFDLEDLSLMPRVGACRARFANGDLSGQADELQLELRVSHAFDVPFVTLETVFGVGGLLLRQALAPVDGRNPSEPTRWTAGLALSAGWTVSRDLFEGFYVAADAAALLYVYRQLEAGEELTSPVALRVGLNLGKRW